MAATRQRPEDAHEISLELDPMATTRDSEVETEVNQTLLRSDVEENPSRGLNQAQARNLYTTHLLSTWNARTYEFAAVRNTCARCILQYDLHINLVDTIHSECLPRDPPRIIIAVCIASPSA